MPEYLAPGVFVEEVSYRAKSIEGVSTTTTGFVGPTRYGPVDGPPDVLTSLVEFERTFGDRRQLDFSDQPGLTHNYMWHAARTFFEQGGKRLYVQRAFRTRSDVDDGCAHIDVAGAADSSGAVPKITIKARFPGSSGERRVKLTLMLGGNVLALEPRQPGTPDGAPRALTVNGLQHRDVVWLSNVTSPPDSPPHAASPPEDPGQYYVAELVTQPTGLGRWEFKRKGSTTLTLADLGWDDVPEFRDKVRVVTATLTVYSADPEGVSQVWPNLPLDPGHELVGRHDSLFSRFGDHPDSQADLRSLPVTVEYDGPGDDYTGIDALDVLLHAGQTAMQDAMWHASTDDERSLSLFMDGGNDGLRPGADEYHGEAPVTSPVKTGLMAFEDIDDISIVAAPGSSAGYANGFRDDAMTIANHLIGHAERMRYRIAVLDAGDGLSIRGVREQRAQLDSKHAAFYYPWVRVLDPVTRAEIVLPPSGFVAGIYARNDVNRAVFKAPANEVVTGALGFEVTLNKSQQEVLNPEGINCFRFFEGRGNRLWGARTASSDPEWKYVNLRRYFAYLEHSIDRGTQWAVFEPNGEQLWANVRRTVSDFLLNEFQMGALLGDKPESAYFVKCDRSTMTQNDLDNGRLVCLIGVAALRPAEFVIFRIGQWTVDAKR
jgi:uncharacterized protein